MGSELTEIKGFLEKHIEPFETMRDSLQITIEELNQVLCWLYSVDKETGKKLIRVSVGFQSIVSDLQWTIDALTELLNEPESEETIEPDLSDPSWDGRKV